jgi:hypothetical protein
MAAPIWMISVYISLIMVRVQVNDRESYLTRCLWYSAVENVY